MKAARRGLTEPLKLLLDTGKAKVDYLDEEGCSALMYAAMGGFEETVKLLVNVGSDLNHADNNGQTAMMHAAYNGHADVVRLLVGGRKSMQTRWISDGVEEEYEASIGPGASREGALCSAAKGGRTEVLKLLIELGSDVNDSYKEEYPLMLAAEGGNLETVRFLVTECDCYDVDREGQNVLDVATSAGHADIVVLLLNWEPAEPEPSRTVKCHSDSFFLFVS